MLATISRAIKAWIALVQTENINLRQFNRELGMSSTTQPALAAVQLRICRGASCARRPPSFPWPPPGCPRSRPTYPQPGWTKIKKKLLTQWKLTGSSSLFYAKLFNQVKNLFPSPKWKQLYIFSFSNSHLPLSSSLLLWYYNAKLSWKVESSTCSRSCLVELTLLPDSWLECTLVVDLQDN